MDSNRFEPPQDGVMVVYAHDRDGRAITASLVPALNGRGVRVIHDGDLKVENVPSLPEWMATGIERHPVICVLSEGFVCQDGHDDSADGRGRLFERRMLYKKYYRHRAGSGCPIIPVALRGFDVDDAPAVFASMSIVRYDPATGAGLDEILRRLAELEPEAAAVRPLRALREIVADLEAADPWSDRAPGLVREWLVSGESGAVCPSDFVRAFPAVERVIKVSGDALLMREVIERCLDMLRDVTLLQPDRHAKAVILICGLAWLLRRRGELPLALTAVRDGIALARGCEDPWVVALGKVCAAQIHREMAEDAAGGARREHLREGLREVRSAWGLFTAADAHGPEIALCLRVEAHLRFTRFRLLRDRVSLVCAAVVAKRAMTALAGRRADEYHELLLLRAEIATACNQLRRAREFIGEAMTVLHRDVRNTPAHWESLARTYLVSARLRHRLGGQVNTSGAVADVECAMKIFDELGLRHGVDTCKWLLITVDPAAIRLTRQDVVLVARFLPDHRRRLLAVESYRRRIAAGACGWRPRKAEWRDVAREILEAEGREC